MQKIQLPADLSAKLAASDDTVGLCDEAGAMKWVALSPDLYREMMLAWADRQFDPAALERARAEPGGMTTAEAVAYLRDVAARHGKP